MDTSMKVPESEQRPGDRYMELVFKIGKFETVLIPVVTNAPQYYDGFGTIELVTGYPVVGEVEIAAADARIVLVRQEALKWQVMRYESGSYGVDLHPDVNDPQICEQNLTDALLKRLKRLCSEEVPA